MQSLPTIVKIYLEKEAWQAMERISRRCRNRKIHALATSRIEELSQRMLAFAEDELSASDETSETDDSEDITESI